MLIVFVRDDCAHGQMICDRILLAFTECDIGAEVAVESNEGYKLKVDLEQQSITTPDGTVYAFEVDAHRKHCLLNGLDDIGLTLQHVDEIKAFEEKHRAMQPWLFA